MIDVDQAIKELWDAALRRTKDTAVEVQAFESARAVLVDLPPDGTTFARYDGVICVVYYTNRDTAGEMRSAVQDILGGVARREFIERTGQLTYVFDSPKVKVTITGADAAPGCEIIAYEETVTKYRMDCSGDDEEVVADVVAESGHHEIGVVESVSPDEESVIVRLDADEGGP